MTTHIKLFITQHFSKILIAVLAFLSPVKHLLIATLVFSFADFITGIFAARKQAKLQGKTNLTDWWQSKKMQKKVFDLVFYLLAIILAYYFEKLFSEWLNFPVSKLTAFIILSVEFWSNMENLSIITGMPLNKKAFFDFMNAIRNPSNKENDSNNTNQQS